MKDAAEVLQGGEINYRVSCSAASHFSSIVLLIILG
jgi:hypothetical protein